jgi:hypothetical protein
MKKITGLFFLTTLFISCSFPNYIFENKAQRTGLDFSKGNWLLNEIEAPYGVNDKLTKLALKYFSENLQERFSYINTTKDLLLPRKINLSPNKNALKDLKTGTNFDYFINIKASHSKNEFESIDITPHKFNNGGQKKSIVIIEIYDLNLLEIIYSQKVIASINMPKDNNDVHFSNSSNSLILGGYKKLINDIDKKSTKR